MNPNTWSGIATRLTVIVLAVLMLTVNASAEWKEKVLYSFQGVPDGSIPAGGVVFDKAGNLYGVTTDGGSGCPTSQSGCGTVFELSPATSGTRTETILYGFDGTHGSYPAGSVIIDSAGNLYGTTTIGGNGQCKLLGYVVGCGVVYELSPPQNGGQWTYAVLYNFQGGNDGLHPTGNLVLDKHGKLYGATWYGGGKGTTCDTYYGGNCGTVFELSPPKKKGGAWTERVLHSFAGIAPGKQDGDGAQPNGGLILGKKGAIYGTTSYGGNDNCNGGSGLVGCGTVFELKPPERHGGAWTEKQIHVFRNGSDGAEPAPVVFGAHGSLYGGAGGGAEGGGIVFREEIANGRWQEAVLYEFNSGTYWNPSVSFFDRAGRLYGGTFAAPGSYSGSVFRLQPPGKGRRWVMSFLYEFTNSPDGAQPNPVLATDNAGDIYGTTQHGGSGNCYPGGCGTVFELESPKM